MPGNRPSDEMPEVPRTDAPPARPPNADDRRGTDEEESVVREREARESGHSEERETSRSVAEDSAGGDREIL
jgi:hypothetical protein